MMITATTHADDVSFRTDVMAVLSRAGCNMGVCHGNANGKGGFKLSLRGQDPDRDFETLTRHQPGRRVNSVTPGESLILRKPTMAVAHEGGQRFAVGSLEYEILKSWIAAGTPADSDDEPHLAELAVEPREWILVEPQNEIQLRVTAKFSDESTRDVTRLAVFEPSEAIVEISGDGMVRFLNQQVPVRLAFVPERPDFAWSAPEPANFVDEHIFNKLRSVRTNPSAVCDDVVFLRIRTHPRTTIAPCVTP